MKVEQGHVDISITTHHSAVSKSKSCIHVLIACRLYLLVKATIMLHLGWRIATYLPLSLKLPFLNGSPLMDGGLSHTDPDLALHFHYGSTSHPCQMHGVPGQLSSLSSFLSISVTYFFYPLPPSPPPSFSLILSYSLFSTHFYLFVSFRRHKCLLFPYKRDVLQEPRGGCVLFPISESVTFVVSAFLPVFSFSLLQPFFHRYSQSVCSFSQSG